MQFPRTPFENGLKVLYSSPFGFSAEVELANPRTPIRDEI
jgi:hypothetical protein